MAVPETVAREPTVGRDGDADRQRLGGGVDPWRPIDVLFEDEAVGAGRSEPAMTVFLAGARCPFSCRFCDLDRHTLDTPTPTGALAAQLELALARLHHRSLPPEATRIKLYNASNFFEPRAVPDADAAWIAERLRGFSRVVVESHPRLLGERCRRFAEDLGGRGAAARLEVAMGLEVADDEVLRRLRKGATLDDFRRAAAFLRGQGIAIRLFLLVGAPFVGDEGRQVEATVSSLRFGRELDAERLSLIPLRPQPPQIARMVARGELSPPSAELVERCLAACVDELERAGGPLVTVDRWDLDRLLAGRSDAARRLQAIVALEQHGLALATRRPER